MTLHDRSSGIIWKWKNQDFRFIGNLFQKFLRGQFKMILFLQFNHHRHTVRQHGTGHIGNIAGLGNQDFIPGIQHGTHGCINGFTAAHRNHDLFV